MEYQYVCFFLLKKKKRKKENLAYYLCIPMYPLFLEWEKLSGIAKLNQTKKHSVTKSVRESLQKGI